MMTQTGLLVSPPPYDPKYDLSETGRETNNVYGWTHRWFNKPFLFYFFFPQLISTPLHLCMKFLTDIKSLYIMCNLCPLAKTIIPAIVSFFLCSECVDSLSWCASIRPLAASFAVPPLLVSRLSRAPPEAPAWRSYFDGHEWSIVIKKKICSSWLHLACSDTTAKLLGPPREGKVVGGGGGYLLCRN